MVNLCNGILHGYKKEGILPFATAWIDLEIIMLSEISQPEKDKYYMISLIWNIMNKNKLTNKIETKA